MFRNFDAQNGEELPASEAWNRGEPEQFTLIGSGYGPGLILSGIFLFLRCVIVLGVAKWGGGNFKKMEGKERNFLSFQKENEILH